MTIDHQPKARVKTIKQELAVAIVMLSLLLFVVASCLRAQNIDLLDYLPF